MRNGDKELQKRLKKWEGLRQWNKGQSDICVFPTAIHRAQMMASKIENTSRRVFHFVSIHTSSCIYHSFSFVSVSDHRSVILKKILWFSFSFDVSLWIINRCSFCLGVNLLKFPNRNPAQSSFSEQRYCKWLSTLEGFRLEDW